MDKYDFNMILNSGILDDGSKEFLIEQAFLLLQFLGFPVEKNTMTLNSKITHYNDMIPPCFTLFINDNKIGVIELERYSSECIIEIDHSFIETNMLKQSEYMFMTHLVSISKKISMTLEKTEVLLNYSLKHLDTTRETDNSLSSYLINSVRKIESHKDSISFSINQSRKIEAVYNIGNYADNECLLGDINYEKIVLSLHREAYPAAFNVIFPDFNFNKIEEYKENLNEKLLLLSALLI